jgi:hypothetical protein
MNSIERECRVFTEHLIGQVPNSYVLRKYEEAHATTPFYVCMGAFDAFLVSVAGFHCKLAKLADCYARIFFPTALLRKKLILLLAILETSSPSFLAVEAVDGGSRAILIARLCGRLFVFTGSLILAALLFAPMQILFRVLQTMGWSRSRPAASQREFRALTPSVRERRES